MVINYKIGDALVSIDNPNKEIGICTGFRHNDSCVEIDGKCYGGKDYFMKTEYTDYTIVDNKNNKNNETNPNTPNDQN